MVAMKPRIVIVGAGMAGLTAAQKLYTTSGDLFDLSIVEAGERIGGRILTSEFAGDRVEMGATWIHGIGGSPIYDIAQKIHALDPDDRPWERMDGFPEDPVTVAEGGVHVDPSVVNRISSLYTSLMDSAKSGEAHCTEGLGVGSFLRHGLQAYRASRGDRTAEEVEAAVFAIHESTERTYTSADDLDGLDLAAEKEYREFPGEQITIAKGYSRVIEFLAAALPPGVIRLGRKVYRIEWCADGPTPSDGPVRLYFEDSTTVTADHVIVTVSLGVLKEVLPKKDKVVLSGLVFSPTLPAFKQDAIRRVGFGVVNKLFLEHDGGEDGRFPFLQMAFHPEPESARHVAKIPRWMRKTASICPIYGGSRVLLVWLAGKEATELEKLDDDEIISAVHATLDGFSSSSPAGNLNRRCNGRTGSNYGSISRVKRSGWASDPLFLGSYSYVAVGSSGDDLDLMAEPLPYRCEDRKSDSEVDTPPLQILFAGEATHRTHYSTTHGAYLSGIREANRLLQHYEHNSK